MRCGLFFVCFWLYNRKELSREIAQLRVPGWIRRSASLVKAVVPLRDWIVMVRRYWTRAYMSYKIIQQQLPNTGSMSRRILRATWNGVVPSPAPRNPKAWYLYNTALMRGRPELIARLNKILYQDISPSENSSPHPLTLLLQWNPSWIDVNTYFQEYFKTLTMNLVINNNINVINPTLSDQYWKI